MKRAAIVVSVLALIMIVLYFAVWNRSGARSPSRVQTTGVPAQRNPTQTVAPTLPEIAPSDQIVVEGRLVPDQFVNLSFNTSGLVSDVFVVNGQNVNKGQVLARLSNRAQYEAAIASAQLELVDAQLAIQALYDNAPLAAAEALQDAANAPAVVKDAEQTLNSLQRGEVNETDIDVARANLAFAEKKLQNAKDAYKPFENKPEDNLQRAAFLSKLSQAQKEYDAQLRNYNALIGTPDDVKITQAEANLELARAQLADVLRRYEILKSGPDPAQVALAQARLENAEAQLAAAQSELQRLELVAPFTGTVTTVSLKPGEYVSPGLSSALLVDFTDWFVETTDLNELNVVRVEVGSPAVIVCDALPDVQLPGRVNYINQVGENREGDITYKAVIALDSIDPRLLWNMTCSVTIQTNNE